MIRLLLVDDEAIIRTALRTIVNWEEIGIVVTGCASNGQDALDQWDTAKPDLVLTDMRMPVLDGLGFMKAAQAQKNPVEWIVLSGHDDFELVREAFLLGALDYILKAEMDGNAIARFCGQVAEQIRQRRASHSRQNTLRELVGRQDLVRAFYQRLLNGETRGNWIAQTCENLDLRYRQGMGALLLIKVSCQCTHPDEIEIPQPETWVTPVLSILETALDEQRLGDAFHLEKDEYAVVLALDGENSRLSQHNVIQSLCRAIASRCNQYMGLTTTIAVSEIRNQGQEGVLPAQLAECRQLIEAAFYLGYGRSYFSQMVGDIPLCGRVNAAHAGRTLQDALGLGGSIPHEALLISRKGNAPVPPLTETQALYDSYVAILAEHIEKGSLQADAIPRLKAKLRQYSSLCAYADLDQLNRWMSIMFEEVTQAQMMGNSLAKAARQYIHMHYSRPISLRDAAVHLYVSEEHLSRVFSSEQGVSFMKYLSTVRIERARELLVKENLKMQEVANRVGYSNVDYFARVFREIMGVSPTQYAKNQKRSR